MSRQYKERIYLSPPHVENTERFLLLEAFDSNWIAPLGPHVDAFENEMAKKLGISHAVALSSGTAALHLSLILLGVQPGDEVFCSTFTFAASANSITYVGAKPVFVDCDSNWVLDPNLLSDELRKRAGQSKLPAAVITVDLYGQCCDYPAIQEICGRYGIPIIEDAAEALGSTCSGIHAGTLGSMGVLSFNGNKIITTSGGGMLLTGSREKAERARFLATQARDSAPHYQHSTIGYNYRMSNLLAAVGRGQLMVLEERVEKRRWINQFYREKLSDIPGISFMPEALYCRSNFWLTCILVDPEKFGATREDIRQHLESDNIESRPVWKPMHLQPVFQGCDIVGGNVSDSIFENGLCLPSGSNMTSTDLDRVLDAFLTTPGHPS